MKLGFVFAGVAATAMFAAQPVMASGTLSSDSLPAAHAPAKTKTPSAATSRPAARKGSRVTQAEGAFPIGPIFSNPFFLVGIVGLTGLAFDALHIVDFGIFQSHQIGPYGTVTA